MATNQLTVSGVQYDGALVNSGAREFVYGIQNTTPPNQTVVSITTSTTTNITPPANAKTVVVLCNLSAGTVTVNGAPVGKVSTSVLDMEEAITTVSVVTTGITGVVEVFFL